VTTTALTPETAAGPIVEFGPVWTDRRSRVGRNGQYQACFVFKSNDVLRHVRADDVATAATMRDDWIARAEEMGHAVRELNR
jgi:hypothetical protein